MFLIEVHGGRVTEWLGSTGASSALSSRKVSRPSLRQSWTAVRRERGVAIATVLSDVFVRRQGDSPHQHLRREGSAAHGRSR